MPASPVYSNLTEADLELTGPDIWPITSAEHAVDRYIFRRPELAYIVAKKRMIARRKKKNQSLEPEFMGVRFCRLYYSDRSGRRDRKGTLRFGHPIDHSSAKEDVRNFLIHLRANLIRNLPNKSLINCSLQLRFYDFDFPNDQILAWQEKWL